MGNPHHRPTGMDSLTSAVQITTRNLAFCTRELALTPASDPTYPRLAARLERAQENAALGASRAAQRSSPQHPPPAAGGRMAPEAPQRPFEPLRRAQEMALRLRDANGEPIPRPHLNSPPNAARRTAPT